MQVDGITDIDLETTEDIDPLEAEDEGALEAVAALGDAVRVGSVRGARRRGAVSIRAAAPLEGDPLPPFPGVDAWAEDDDRERVPHAYSDEEYQRVLEAWRTLGTISEVAEAVELHPAIVRRYFRTPLPPGVHARRPVDEQAAHEDKIALDAKAKEEARARIEAREKAEREARARDEALELESRLVDGVRKTAVRNMRAVIKASPGVEALASAIDQSLAALAASGQFTTLAECMTAVKLLNAYAQASYRTALLVRESTEVRLLREAAPVPEVVALDALAVTGKEAARLVATANRALARATRLQAGGAAIELSPDEDGVFGVRTGDPEATP